MDHDQNPHSRLLAHEALFRLDRLWPEAALGVRALVPAPCQVKPRPSPRWTVPYFLEALLREWGRLVLIRKHAEDPLLKEGCPLAARLNSAFVLQRVCKGLMRYATAGPEVPDRHDALSLLAESSRRLKEDMAALRQAAQWTPAGARLFSEIECFSA